MVECNLQKQPSPHSITLQKPRFQWEEGLRVLLKTMGKNSAAPAGDREQGRRNSASGLLFREAHVDAKKRIDPASIY